MFVYLIQLGRPILNQGSRYVEFTAVLLTANFQAADRVDLEYVSIVVSMKACAVKGAPQETANG
jgi:hypothetical protein